MQTYDHIVIGAGSAGCAVAARLSEDPSVSVLLIEAGGPVRGINHLAPAAYAQQFHGRTDWDYFTEPERGLEGRRIHEPRAKAIGGCSVMNAQMWVRGNPDDYDGWGLDGWGWDDVRPVFDRIEQRHAPLPGAGGTGPMRVTEHPAEDPFVDAFANAVQAATGAPVGADLSSSAEATGRTPTTIWRGRRWHSAKAYLHEAVRRPNLTVLPRALVRRVVLRDGRAVGVEHERFGRRGAAAARGEVVLCAGAFNTPHLLQLSGIGDPAHLRSIGVEPLVESPGVGRHLQEHPLAMIVWELAAGYDGLFGHKHPKHALEWLVKGTGLLSTTTVRGVGHVRTSPDVPHPDLQLDLIPGYGWLESPGVFADHHRPTASVFASYWTPRSLGTVLAASADPRALPAVRLNMLTERADVEAMIRAVRLVREIAATEPMAGMLGVELHPGPDVQDDDDLERWLRRYCEHTYHPSCTARMGAGEDGVLDARLRVRGVEGLRVADCSALPRVPRANTHAPATMIGERCAAFVREDASTERTSEHAAAA